MIGAERSGKMDPYSACHFDLSRPGSWPDGTPPGHGSRYEEDSDHSCSSLRKTRDQGSVVRILLGEAIGKRSSCHADKLLFCHAAI